MGGDKPFLESEGEIFSPLKYLRAGTRVKFGRTTQGFYINGGGTPLLGRILRLGGEKSPGVLYTPSGGGITGAPYSNETQGVFFRGVTPSLAPRGGELSSFMVRKKLFGEPLRGGDT